MKSIFTEGKKYTFSDYFELGNPTEEIIKSLGYSFFTQPLDLPRKNNISPELINRLSTAYYSILPKISVNSEIAKREVMIAPVLHAVIQYMNARLNIEYSVSINDKLSGTIDYLFRSSQELIVIEAKKGDLDRGFNQLAAEMIAMDIYEEEQTDLARVYGAITIGEVWRFAVLEREKKHLIKDIHTFRFPEDLHDLLSILSGMLEKEEHPNA
ncbi:Type I restriction enzyme R protein N-terminal domain-containing protein [Candidatus Electrothrix laxa]